MKKILSLFFAVLIYNFAMAQCNEIFISEYVEGSHNNKVLELYNPTDQAISLDDNYRIIRWSNGSTSSDQQMEYIALLTGSIGGHSVFVISGDLQDVNATGQDTCVFEEVRNVVDLWVDASYSDGVQGSKCFKWNGDDAISLQKLDGGSWIDIDILGEIGVRPPNWLGTTSPNGGWDDEAPYSDGLGTYLTKNHTLIRKSEIEIGNINETWYEGWNALAEWDSLPMNSFENLGMHTSICGDAVEVNFVSKDDIISFYPNPVLNGKFTVKSKKDIHSVEILNVIGQKIAKYDLDTRKKEFKVELPICENGIYLVKVSFENEKFAIKKILLQKN